MPVEAQIFQKSQFVNSLCIQVLKNGNIMCSHKMAVYWRSAVLLQNTIPASKCWHTPPMPHSLFSSHFPAVDLNIPEVTIRFSMYLLRTWFSDFSLEFSSLTELTLWEIMESILKLENVRYKLFFLCTPWASQRRRRSDTFWLSPRRTCSHVLLFLCSSCDSERYLEKF